MGGTWNLNEEKNPDAEIIASGVFIGFFIYTIVILISYGFGSNHQKKTLVVRREYIDGNNNTIITAECSLLNNIVEND